jgi:hypothetical protein
MVHRARQLRDASSHEDAANVEDVNKHLSILEEFIANPLYFESAGLKVNRFKNIKHGDTADTARSKSKNRFFAVFAVSPWLKIVLSIIPPGRSIYGGMAIKLSKQRSRQLISTARACQARFYSISKSPAPRDTHERYARSLATFPWI